MLATRKVGKKVGFWLNNNNENEEITESFRSHENDLLLNVKYEEMCNGIFNLNTRDEPLELVLSQKRLQIGWGESK